MAKQVRPWLTKPDTNHEPRVRAPDEASTSGFHQGQRNAYSSTEGRIYGCNLHLPSQYERDCLANRGASIYVRRNESAIRAVTGNREVAIAVAARLQCREGATSEIAPVPPHKDQCFYGQFFDVTVQL